MIKISFLDGEPVTLGATVINKKGVEFIVQDIEGKVLHVSQIGAKRKSIRKVMAKSLGLKVTDEIPDDGPLIAAKQTMRDYWEDM